MTGVVCLGMVTHERIGEFGARTRGSRERQGTVADERHGELANRWVAVEVGESSSALTTTDKNSGLYATRVPIDRQGGSLL